MTHDSKKERNQYDLSIFKLSADALKSIEAKDEYYLTHDRIEPMLGELITSKTSKLLPTPTRLESGAQEPGSRADPDLEQTLQIDIERRGWLSKQPENTPGYRKVCDGPR